MKKILNAINKITSMYKDKYHIIKVVNDSTTEYLVDIYTGKKDANFGSPDGEYNFFTCSNTSA